jgi:NAD-dependent deacetylase
MTNKKHIVVLTGAGISAESGLKTFRDSDGLWMGYNIEDVATPGAFARNPKMVLDFYNMRRKEIDRNFITGLPGRWPRRLCE